MAQYEDDLENDDLDDDQEPDHDDREDYEGDPVEVSVANQIEELFGVDLDLPHELPSDPEEFLHLLNDRLLALDDEKLGYAQASPGYRGPGRGKMPSNRKLSAAKRLTPKGQRMTAARSVRVLAELTNNASLTPADEAQASRARQLSHGRLMSPARGQDVLNEVLANAGL